MKKGFCVTSDEVDDYFVGVRFKGGEPEVVFPHGYKISDDEKERRKDVFRLLSLLIKFADKKYYGDKLNKDKDLSKFPLTSYQYIIYDFLRNGYYTEKETRYVEATKGKISWKRTIQKEKPQVDGNNVIYLKYQVKTNQIKDDTLITNIHKYCVYKCLFKFGWLFFPSDILPPKPGFKIDKGAAVYILKQALKDTFNDSKKMLFQSMINVLLEEDKKNSFDDVTIGVQKFEIVWERLIDFVFGEPNKDIYFPHAKWHIIKDSSVKTTSALIPDTIMKYDNKLYVLDAKYYQYGITENPNDLPQTASIQKQITYGRYISGLEIAPEDKNEIYNAFIMPFQSDGQDNYKFEFVSVGTVDWEDYNERVMNYQYVLGMLLDTRYIITTYSRHNNREIEHLADLIEDSLETFKSEQF